MYIFSIYMYIYIYIYVCLLPCSATRNRGSTNSLCIYIYIYIPIYLCLFVCSIKNYLFNPICGLGLEEVFWSRLSADTYPDARCLGEGYRSETDRYCLSWAPYCAACSRSHRKIDCLFFLFVCIYLHMYVYLYIYIYLCLCVYICICFF